MQTKISQEQKKIIYISAVALLSFILFWGFIYKPQNSKFSAIKNELVQTENRIAEILSFTKGAELAESVKKIRINLDKAYSQFPKGEEEVIRSLSDEANRLKIKVKNITTLGTRALDAQLKGHKIEELPISMNLACEYRELGEYLDRLKNNAPILIKVTQLDTRSAGEGNPELNIELKLSAYLSKEN